MLEQKARCSLIDSGIVLQYPVFYDLLLCVKSKKSIHQPVFKGKRESKMPGFSVASEYGKSKKRHILRRFYCSN